MCRGFSSPEKPATGSQRGVENNGARERPGKVVHRKPETIRLPLASPETGLSQEPPETLADDGIDLLWGAEGGQSRSGPRTEHCGTRSDQPPVNRNPVQEVRRRSLIVRYRGGSSAVTSKQPASHAIRASVGSTLPARVRVSGLDSDSSPHSMPRQVRVDACAAILINVVETANASLDMTAAAVEAAKAEAKTPIMEEAKQEEPKPTQNGMYRITAVFELKAGSKNEAVEMAKDLLNMIGVEAEIRIG